MGVKWMDQGENWIVSVVFGDTATGSALYLGLMMNLSEPAEDATLADMVEPSGFGYARKTLTRGTTYWTISGDTATYKTEQTFKASGGDWGSITGFFLSTTLNNTGKILAVNYFSTALQVDDGKGIKVTPSVKCG